MLKLSGENAKSLKAYELFFSFLQGFKATLEYVHTERERSIFFPYVKGNETDLGLDWCHFDAAQLLFFSPNLFP